MRNNDAGVPVKYHTNVNQETTDNNSDSIDLRGNNNDLGENGNTREAVSQPRAKPEKFLLRSNAPTYGLELPTCTRNAMIIFNQENFVNPGRKRVGSGEDVKALTETFEQFKFKVFTCEDYKKKDLLETLKGFWKRKYEAYGCVCVALLTHGREGELDASDRSFPESDFFECFDVRENKTLAGKPIIIIVQACRGEILTDNVKVELAMRGDEDKPRFMYLPTHSNILVFRSCYLNTASIRYPAAGGSLFIRSLCRQIKENPGQDFEYICVQVKRLVAEKFNEFQENQMPVVTSTLIRKLYLKDPGANAQVQGYDQDMRMPPKCFLQYFNYIKKCYRLYIKRKDFTSAATQDQQFMNDVLDLVENNATSGQQLAFIKDASSYLKNEGERCRCSNDQSDEFPEFDFVYFHYHE